MPLLCFVLLQFLKIYISQGSVVTLFQCGNIFNDIAVVRRVWSERIDKYLAKI